MSHAFPAPQSPPPPPYSPPPESNGLSQPSQPAADFSHFQLQLWSSCASPHRLYYSACRVDRFVLLGTNTGEVLALDTCQPDLLPRTILWMTARQLMTLPECHLLLVLPERAKKVRCYFLPAIVRLCYGVFALPWTAQLDQERYPLPTLSSWLQHHQPKPTLPSGLPTSVTSSALHTASHSTSSASSSTSGPAPDSSTSTPASNSDTRKRKEHCTLPPMAFVPDSSIMLVTRNLHRKVYLWNNTVALQDYCYKLANTKDGLSLHTYQTYAFVFVATLHPNKIELWQCPSVADAMPLTHLPPPLAPVRAFWVPTTAQSVSFADDRATLKYLVTVFTTGAAMITMSTSQVEAIVIDQQLEQLYHQVIRQQQAGHAKIGYTVHLVLALPAPPPPPPHPYDPPANALPSLSTTPKLKFPRATHTSPFSLPLTTSSTSPLPWTSMVQLPCYPDQLPGLTTKFSLPPSYNAVIQHTPYQSFDPVALPSNVAPQLFLATFGAYSMIIDRSGALFSTQVYHWYEPLVHVAFVAAAGCDWYMVGFGKSSVTLMHLLTAQSHRLMNEQPVRFLGQHNDTLYWSCQHDKLHQVYYLCNKFP
ncbi:hypothetical protein DM01DRAFT_1400262 [Hesseltinella vesiculosa]|uniref:CNH domain-containing protein n=1 Tax=Hesseltinella vesiculosa TaxID=101127 RepID=A0A1X2GS11_9FUNG|nr:hypothetical protein DM01DRAFT_1400262 [Hesseltinella vesiculosa]